MAFRQAQQRPQATRPQPSQAPEAPATRPPLYKRPTDEEWILFSPQSDTQSFSQTSQTPRTATYLSDFGSLETHLRSQPRGGSQDVSDNLTAQGTDLDDDGAELDSLDDGLHAFHSPFSATSHHNLDQSGGTVLPTHDGFGTFPSAGGLQEHLWQFERYNPHRRAKYHRRRSSLQRRLDAMEEEPEMEVEDERTARIERWRLDQSRVVLEEIERETRRRRKRLGRMTSSTADGTSTRQASVPRQAPEHEPPQHESFWQRLTRRVIQDLIGLDDTTLSVLFGEEYVDASPTPKEPSPIATAAAQESRVTFRDSEHSWETKLLERIARELGILIHQVAENDGAAFSTYSKMMDQQPPEYAGLPRNFARSPSLRQRMRSERPSAITSTDPAFAPTLPQTPLTPANEHSDTSLWGIEEEPEQPNAEVEEVARRQEREYWEQEVDVKMIFTFLKNRFSRAAAEAVTTAPADHAPPSGPLPASWAAADAHTEGFRRAEVIRRQHPLVSRAADRAAAAMAQSRRRDSLLLRRHHLHQMAQRRSGSSSCASQSTKRSRHTRSASSRHYWDLGGSVGSVGSGPALGAWAEV